MFPRPISTQPIPTLTRRLAGVLTAMLATLLLIGCSGYRPNSGLFGGFASQKLSANMYHVYFLGNGYTSQARASNLALLRSADITLQSGMNYFVLVRGTPAVDVGNSNKNNSDSFTYQGRRYYIAAPSNDNLMIMFKTPPGGVRNNFYTAKKICDTMAADYDTTCGDFKLDK
ncbi:MAG: hypothetical protein QM529_00515 [Hydrotalea sp.]|nr:hypothetical protein [Hydrotalea sp.]